MGKLLYESLSHEVIGAAMEVHRTLGYGFLEAVYENALAHELALRSVQLERQKQLPVQYKGLNVGHYVADIVVEDVIILELKSLSKGLAREHHAQIINYLVATGIQVGLLLNFGQPSLEYKRFTKTKNPRNPRQKRS
ncbi:GxxExxY protein [Candidatus Leptofilum sp.]|uniref:GxxExxY protein n=1 Tax=Candidatus Leptofilum sp. TaxID=3241576 RepID=UPI003B59B878